MWCFLSLFSCLFCFCHHLLISYLVPSVFSLAVFTYWSVCPVLACFSAFLVVCFCSSLCTSCFSHLWFYSSFLLCSNFFLLSSFLILVSRCLLKLSFFLPLPALFVFCFWTLLHKTSQRHSVLHVGSTASMAGVCVCV